MRFKMMAFAAAMLLAVPAIAQTADPAPSAAAPKPKKERQVCRALAGRTGSNMMQTVCHTKSDWAIIDENGLDPTANIGSRSSTDNGNLGPGIR